MHFRGMWAGCLIRLIWRDLKLKVVILASSWPHGNIHAAESQTIWEYSSSCCLLQKCKSPLLVGCNAIQNMLQCLANYCKILQHWCLQNYVAMPCFNCNKLLDIAKLVSGTICCNALLSTPLFVSIRYVVTLCQMHATFCNGASVYCLVV